MKIVRNIVPRPTPVALPGRSIHLGKGEEAPISDAEADEPTVAGLERSKAVRVRAASDADKAKFPTFDETPNPEFVAVQRRRTQLGRAKIRAGGGIA